MRIGIGAIALTFGLGVACSGGSAKQGDAPPRMADAPIPPTDAFAYTPCTPTSGSNVSMRMIGSVTGGATLATAAPNDGRLFVLQQSGQIRVFVNEQLLPDPFLDVSATITAESPPGERGLLGLAFHPNYAQNGTFFIFYTTDTADVLERFQVSATDPNKADPMSGQVVVSIADFAENHNGGMLNFGSDGYLYISTGDGGGAGDPNRTAQDDTQLLGKMLRIDVDHPSGMNLYSSPADNPNVVSGTGAPEVFMKGLRNPWRWAFDRATGDMYIGDVGQNLIEEVDVLPAGQQKGLNLGWSMWEGSGANSCYGNYTCSTTGMTFPVHTRTHASGWAAVIGGDVYRGPCYPDLTGYYFFSDYVAHTMSMAKLQSDGSLVVNDVPPPAGDWPGTPSSFHSDSRGELYMTTTSGAVWHLEAGP